MGGVYLGEGKNGGSTNKQRKKWGVYTYAKEILGAGIFSAEGWGDLRVGLPQDILAASLTIQDSLHVSIDRA